MYGQGIAGFIATAVAERALDELRASATRQPEMLDVSRLRPGETYTVTTRPAPSAKERKLLDASAKAHAKLDKAERPTRSQRAAERRLRKAERGLRKAKTGSRRERQATAEVRRLAARLDRSRRPGRKARKLRNEVARVDAALASVSDAAMAKAQGRSRPPRTQRFR
jgi:hypothetical protein